MQVTDLYFRVTGIVAGEREVPQDIQRMEYLEFKNDPLGKTTGIPHHDEEAIALYYKDAHIGFVSAQRKAYTDSIASKRPQKDIEIDFDIKSFIHQHSEKVALVVTYASRAPDNSVTSVEYKVFNKDKGVQLNMPDTRVYVKQGKQGQSITQFLKIYPSDSDPLIQWAMQFGNYHTYQKALGQMADEGTRMHKECEDALLHYKKTGEIIESPIKGFLTDYQPEVIAVEEQVFDDELELAGTFDALIRIPKKVRKISAGIYVVDWKSSKRIVLDENGTPVWIDGKIQLEKRKSPKYASPKQKCQVGFYAKHKRAGALVALLENGNAQGYTVSEADVESEYAKIRALKTLF